MRGNGYQTPVEPGSRLLWYIRRYDSGKKKKKRTEKMSDMCLEVSIFACTAWIIDFRFSTRTYYVTLRARITPPVQWTHKRSRMSTTINRNTTIIIIILVTSRWVHFDIQILLSKTVSVSNASRRIVLNRAKRNVTRTVYKQNNMRVFFTLQFRRVFDVIAEMRFRYHRNPTVIIRII